MKFSSHGGLKLWVEDNILFMEVSGSWNLEKAKEFTTALNNDITPLVTPPFFALGILHNDWMPTADAIPHLNEATRRAIRAGLVKEAYVSENPLPASIAGKLVLPDEDSNYQKREFRDIDEAIAWLKNHQANEANHS